MPSEQNGLMFTPTDLQMQTLRLYGELVSRRETWPGQLILALGAGTSATGLPAAVSIAGGTSLTIDPDISIVKSVFRQGGLDFVVNTLDEALRVLKNQVRQGRALAVALTADPATIAGEVAQRGVLADLRIDFAGSVQPTTPAVEVLQYDPITPSQTYATWLRQQGWQETTLTRETPAALTQLDAELIASIEDPLRRRWLQQISRYQRPLRERHLWLSVAEAKAL